MILMLSRVSGAFVNCLSEIDPITENSIQQRLIYEVTVPSALIGSDKFSGQQGCRFELHKAPEDGSYPFGVGLVNQQFAVANFIAEGRPATHPFAALPRGSDLVANALPDQLALELRKSHQDVQRHAAHGILGVKRLGNGYER